MENNSTDPKKLNIKKIVFISGSVIVGSFVLAIMYLYMKSYDIQYELKTFSQYWQENNLIEEFEMQGNQIDMIIPENVVNTELMLWMKEMPMPSRYKVKNIQLDSKSNRININGSLYGISLPLSMTFEPVLQNGKIIVNFNHIIIGQSIKLKETSSYKLMGFLFENNFPIMLNAKSLFHSNMIIIDYLDWEEENFKLSLKINDTLLRTELSIIKSAANNEILSKFEKSEIDAEKSAAKYIINIDQITESDIERIIKDVLSTGELASNLLAIAEPDTAKKVFDNYGKNLKGIDINQIAETRKVLLSKQLKPYLTALNDTLQNTYFNFETMHINKGQLYSVLKRQYITPQSLTLEEGLLIPEATLKRLSFFYDKESELLLLAYKLDEDEFLIMNKDEFTTMSKSAYEEGTSYIDTGWVSPVNDKATWESLYNEMKSYYQDDEVFIRYMKADERYAFVIASPTYNYQSFKAMAFEKKAGEWTILEEDVQTIYELNKAHPEFNLETTTIEIEKVEIYQLGEDMYEVILEDMKDKGILNSNDELTIIYCSYGNDYIAFSLSDGNEYVYKVYSLYLHTVYDKETAQNIWGDLPEIITLQDPPKELDNDTM